MARRKKEPETPSAPGGLREAPGGLREALGDELLAVVDDPTAMMVYWDLLITETERATEESRKQQREMANAAEARK